MRLAEKIIAGQEASSDKFTEFYEDRQSEKKERLFMEFNTLSVVYGKPSEKFLRDQVLKQSIATEKKYYPKERGFKTASQEDKLLQDDEKKEEPKQEVDLLNDMLGGGPVSTSTTQPTNQTDDLLGMDLLGGSQPTQPAQSSADTDLLGAMGAAPIQPSPA